jgi:hypothetical protein
MNKKKAVWAATDSRRILKKRATWTEPALFGVAVESKNKEAPARAGFYLRQQIARSVFVSKKFHFLPSKTHLALVRDQRAVAPKSQPF